MRNIIVNYENLVNSLPQLIKESKYKTEHFINIIGVATATFYRKLKTNSFTIDEVKIISKELYPLEFYKAELEESLKLSEKQIKTGKVLANEDVLRKIRQKYC